MAEQQVAVVTGGGSGIGLGIVRHLAESGMAVVGVDRDEAACEQARRAFAGNDRVRVIAGDIGSPEGAKLAIAAAIDAFGRLDLLCNNAAFHPIEELAGHSLDSWRETFRVNVDGPLLCTQQAVPHMARQGGGSIVHIGSISGVAPYAGGGAYASSKAALHMLTRVMAIEFGPQNIRVNCICPGAIQHRAGEDSAVPSSIPIGRRGTIADVAALVSYLASDESGYMTGSIIRLDGGATAGRVRVTKRQPR